MLKKYKIERRLVYDNMKNSNKNAFYKHFIDKNVEKLVTRQTLYDIGGLA